MSSWFKPNCHLLCPPNKGCRCGTLTLASGLISDTSGAISFGSDDLSTTGTVSVGIASVLTLSAGSVTDTSGAISFGSDDLSTTGTLAAGATSVTTLKVGVGANTTLVSSTASGGAQTLTLPGTPSTAGQVLEAADALGTLVWATPVTGTSVMSRLGTAVYPTTTTDSLVVGGNTMTLEVGVNKMFFDSSNGSFRGGVTNGTSWNTRGALSFAYGLDTSATADASHALGFECVSTAVNSHAIGTSCQTAASNSMALGTNSNITNAAHTGSILCSATSGASPYTVTAANQVVFGGTGGFRVLGGALSVKDTLTLDSGVITDTSGAISFGSDDLSTTGTVSVGTASVLTLDAGSVTDTSGAISFGSDDLSTTGTVSVGTASVLTLDAGSVTDTSGAISFGNDDLSTTGTLAAGATSVTTVKVGVGANTTLVSSTASGGAQTLTLPGTPSTAGQVLEAADALGTLVWATPVTATNVMSRLGTAVYPTTTTDSLVVGSNTMAFQAGVFKMFFDSSNGSFRGGRVNTATWTTRGALSFAYGDNTSATGDLSFALGAGCLATANNSFAIGNNCQTSCPYTMSLGRNSNITNAAHIGSILVSAITSFSATTYAVTAAEQIVLGGAGGIRVLGGTLSVKDTLTFDSGIITDTSGAISFGSDDLSTTGTLAAGATSVTTVKVGVGANTTLVSSTASGGAQTLTLPGTPSTAGQVLEAADALGTLVWTTPVTATNVMSRLGTAVYPTTTTDSLVVGSNTMAFQAGVFKMFFDSSNGSFRGGRVNTATWTTRGALSFAYGDNTSATGDLSFALGAGCLATANNSFAIGNNCRTSCPYTMSLGRNSNITNAAHIGSILVSAITSFSATTYAVTAAEQIVLGGAGGIRVLGGTLSVKDTLTLDSGIITDTSGAISFGSDNLSTTGTITGGSVEASAGNIFIPRDNRYDFAYGYGSAWGIRQLSADNTLRFNFNGTDYVTMDPIFGRVGIGITNPSKKFQVEDGSVRVSGLNTDTDVNHTTGSTNGASFFTCRYNLVQIGDIRQATTSSVSYNTTSDHRLKENIIDTPLIMETLKQVRVVNFNYLNDDHECIGVIAHELQEVFPNAAVVSGMKDETWKDCDQCQSNLDECNCEIPLTPKYQAVDYGKLTPMCIKAIQELSEENAQLRLDLNDIKQRLSALENTS